MKGLKIVVLEADAIGEVSYEPLARFGELITYEHTPNDIVAERVADADIIVPNKCIINAETIGKADRLKLICEAATGYNNIDIEYCKGRGIPVTNAKGYSTEAVVQHTFALLLSVWEKLDYYAGYVETGKYSAGDSFTHMGVSYREISGKRFGIIGLGEIGRRVAEVAAAFGAEVVYYSASGRTYDVPYRALGFDDFLSSCDIISCHAPLNEKTKGLMNREAFEKMKPTAVFLNLGRGPIVVEKDLVWALENEEITAAALDVYEEEPLHKDGHLMKYIERKRNNNQSMNAHQPACLQVDDNVDKEIKEFSRDRLLLTPHVAWAPVEARERLVRDVEASIEAWIEDKPRSVVY